MYYDFAPYVSVEERRAQAQKKIAQLRKKGHKVSPVVIEGPRITKTFWGKAWCENLEAYSDYASRLPRGRTYVRNGSVIDLQISKGAIKALVSGSSIYTAEVSIPPADKHRWGALVSDCTGQIGSVVELLTGKLSDHVMDILCRTKTGLFPTSDEISLSCSCPDGAWLCKHLAAVLYGVGARLDTEPELLFLLRGVDQMDLIGEAQQAKAFTKRSQTRNTVATENLADIFGIELDTAPKKRTPAKPRNKERLPPRPGKAQRRR